MLQKSKFANEKEQDITDILTGCYNRRHFYHQLESETTKANYFHHPVSIIILDIDNFKKYYYEYMHAGGDKILIQFSQCIHSCLRKSDSLYRHGGDVFFIILPQTTGSEALKVGQQIMTAVKNYW